MLKRLTNLQLVFSMDSCQLLDLYGITCEQKSREVDPPEGGTDYDMYGFSTISGPLSFLSQYQILSTSMEEKARERTVKWEKMLRQWEVTKKVPSKLERRVYKGVPFKSRMSYWWSLARQCIENYQSNEQVDVWNPHQ